MEKFNRTVKLTLLGQDPVEEGIGWDADVVPLALAEERGPPPDLQSRELSHLFSDFLCLRLFILCLQRLLSVVSSISVLLLHLHLELRQVLEAIHGAYGSAEDED